MNSPLKNNQTINVKAEAAKTKQVNIRLTAHQERLLKQHCIRNGLTTQELVISALASVIGDL